MNKFHTASKQHHCGFTLVEMLVVIAIVVLLMAITVTSVNFQLDAERVRSGARQIQSTLSGARDRAIYARERRGVRLLIDAAPTGTFDADGKPIMRPRRTVSSMIYIQPAPPFPWEGEATLIDIERQDGTLNFNYHNNGDGEPDLNFDVDGDGTDDEAAVTILHAVGRDADGDGNPDEAPGWWFLKKRKLLGQRARMRIPAEGGDWYEVDTSLIDDSTANPPLHQYLILTVPYRDPAPADADEAVVVFPGVTYQLELPPIPMGEDPMHLPDGVVVDLDASKVPDFWRPSVAQDASDPDYYFDPYSPFMDIMFSPRGTVTASAAVEGKINLYVAELEAVNRITVDMEDGLASKRLPIELAPWPSGRDGEVQAPGNFSLMVPADDVVVDADGNTEPIGDRKVVTLFTRTGAIITSDVDGRDYGGAGNNPNFADDPYFFAETGEVTGQ